MTIILSRKDVSVIQIRDTGESKYMSFRGNTSMLIESADDVDDFIEHCYDEYNINDFSELEFEVFIVNAGSSNEIYYKLYKGFSSCSVLGSADIKQIIPVAVALKHAIKKKQNIIVSFMSNIYEVTCNANGFVSANVGKGKPTVTLAPEDLIFLHDINISDFSVDESELDKVRCEAAKDKEKSEKFLKDAEEKIEKLQAEITECRNAIKKAEPKSDDVERDVHVVSFEKPSDDSDDRRVTATINGSIIWTSRKSSSTNPPPKKKQCYFVIDAKFMDKSDKQVAARILKRGVEVKKGDKIGEVIYKNSDGFDRVIKVKAIHDGIFFFFNRYFDPADKIEIGIPAKKTSLSNFFTSISKYERISPEHIIGVYGKNGDSRRAAIAWYNKLYEKQEK